MDEHDVVELVRRIAGACGIEDGQTIGVCIVLFIVGVSVGVSAATAWVRRKSKDWNLEV